MRQIKTNCAHQKYLLKCYTNTLPESGAKLPKARSEKHREHAKDKVNAHVNCFLGKRLKRSENGFRITSKKKLELVLRNSEVEMNAELVARRRMVKANRQSSGVRHNAPVVERFEAFCLHVVS